VQAPARSRTFWLAQLLKLGVVAMLVFACLNLDAGRFASKGMPIRLVVYPLLLAILPVVWALVNRRRAVADRAPYPAAADVLITLPFFIDMLGNCLGLYDSISSFDDICHFLNWMLLTAGICVLLIGRRDLPPWVLASLALAFGATTAVVWEVVEYLTFVANNTHEAPTAYADTIGDLSLGLAGTLVAAAGVGLAARARR
jgi:uncharacterized membrane protein YjdF